MKNDETKNLISYSTKIPTTNMDAYIKWIKCKTFD